MNNPPKSHGRRKLKRSKFVWAELSRVRKSAIILLAAVVAVVAANVANFGIQTDLRAQSAHEDIGLAAADVGRDLGYGPLMALAEDFYYQVINPAAVGGKPSGGAVFGKVVPKVTASISASATPANNTLANNPEWGPANGQSAPPANVVSPASKALSGEGVWQPTKILVNGQVAVRITRVRPDSVHTSFLDTLIWMDPKLLAFQQIPGTLEPKGNYDHGTGMVAKALRPFYVAGINGGYKTVNMHGGFYFKGQTVIPLRTDVATLLTYPDGSIDVANWGRDKIKPGYLTARQNLPMLVENGKNQVTDNNAAQWGNLAWGTASGGNFVWRSAIGVRADGTVVHLVGPSMSQSDLADLMVRAGAVRAMCLDMNNGWASSFLYGPYGQGVPVDPQILRSPSRFLLSSTRDFIAVFAKSPATPAN
jgi:hypothetical protein